MTQRKKNLILFGLMALCCVLWSAVVVASDFSPFAIWGGPVLLGSAFAVGDAQLVVTKALPNGAASVTTDGFDLGHGTTGDFLANCELVISAPALVVGDLADAATMTYIVQHDTDAAFGTVATLIDNALVQTGAGGAGAAAATATIRLPSTTKRHVRVKATNSGAGDASDKSVTVSLKF